MATKKKPSKRGWRQTSSIPQSRSLMERLAALSQQQANENERTGRTQPGKYDSYSYMLPADACPRFRTATSLLRTRQ